MWDILYLKENTCYVPFKHLTDYVGVGRDRYHCIVALSALTTTELPLRALLLDKREL
jgi:hypothetical protein